MADRHACSRHDLECPDLPAAWRPRMKATYHQADLRRRWPEHHGDELHGQPRLRLPRVLAHPDPWQLADACEALEQMKRPNPEQRRDRPTPTTDGQSSSAAPVHQILR
jgi:hypothetical protein